MGCILGCAVRIFVNYCTVDCIVGDVSDSDIDGESSIGVINGTAVQSVHVSHGGQRKIEI